MTKRAPSESHPRPPQELIEHWREEAKKWRDGAPHVGGTGMPDRWIAYAEAYERCANELEASLDHERLTSAGLDQ